MIAAACCCACSNYLEEQRSTHKRRASTIPGIVDLHHSKIVAPVAIWHRTVSSTSS